MKNTFGTSVTLTLFGESHGAAVGAVIDGLCPGIEVNDEEIKNALKRRRPSLLSDTKRSEPDNYNIISGVFNGKTTGTPLCIVIPNTCADSAAYNYGTARPSHADYTAYCKYHGFEDYRGGGHFSGRVTAALTAAGAILTTALNNVNVKIATHILFCGGVYDRSFNNFEADAKSLREKDFPVLDDESAKKMLDYILSVKKNGDSTGGITQTLVNGLTAGVGEPWFDSLEGVISHAVFSIGAIKGIDFGSGFDMCSKTGSQCNDAFCTDSQSVYTLTNNNGGINGGISNGMPIVFRCAVKPTPSIYKTQQTVDFINMKNTEISVTGRHDPAIIRRICPVIDSVTALVLCDALAQRFGTDVFCKGM